MKFIDEYRDPDTVAKLVKAIHGTVTQNWTLMEICGGQTHAIVRFGLDELLPNVISLVHGPGCPVCVTPIELIDKAIQITKLSDVILCSFGDMLRVPGTDGDLISAKAKGGDVRVVYSPMDSLRIARENPQKQVVFFAVGFETTAPANAMAVYQARENRVRNFSLLVSHVLVPPAMEALLSSEENCVQGFLAAGHVCTIMGQSEYEPIARKYHVPIIITGFEPLDILEGVYHCVRQLEQGRCEVENHYARSVRSDGNLHAQKIIKEVFEVIPRKWRGIGLLPGSGLGLREDFRAHDAEVLFGLNSIDVEESKECIAGEVLRGIKKPFECPAFGTKCKPEHPLGAPMVSSEGACAAYHNHRRNAYV